MPDAKGRRQARPGKRRSRQRARPERGAAPRSGTGMSATAPPVQPRRAGASASPPSRLPSPTARATGFMIALVTAFLAVVMIKDALTHASGASAAIQVVGGLLLVLLALAVGALVLVPGRVRALFRRR